MRPRTAIGIASITALGLAAVAACVGGDPDPATTPPIAEGGASSSGASSGNGSSGGSSGTPTDAPNDTTPAPPPGSLDTTFANGPFGGATIPSLQAVTVDTMGRTYIAGKAQCSTDANALYDVAVARFDPSGKIDITWGESGRACLGVEPNDASDETPFHLAIDGSGKLVVAVGYRTDFTSFPPAPYVLALMRFDGDGKPDTSFDGDGVAKMTVPGNELYKFSSILGLAVDGAQIYVVGSTPPFGGEPSDAWIVRFLGNGTPDNGFGTNGVREIAGTRPFRDIATRGGIAYTVSRTIAADGGGNASVHGFSQDGLDAGVFATAMASTGRHFSTALLAPAGGGFFVAGTTDLPPPNGFNVVYGRPAVMKVDNSGTKDGTFGNGGTGIASALTSRDAEPRVAIQKDGKVLVTGTIALSTDGSLLNEETAGDFAVARFTSAGQLDGTYGTGGIARPGTAADTFLLDMALDPSNDKLVVLAQKRPPTPSAYAIYRFNP